MTRRMTREQREAAAELRAAGISVRPSRSKYMPGRVITSLDELLSRLDDNKSHYFGAFVRNAAFFKNLQFRTVFQAMRRQAIRVAVPKEHEKGTLL